MLEDLQKGTHTYISLSVWHRVKKTRQAYGNATKQTPKHLNRTSIFLFFMTFFCLFPHSADQVSLQQWLYISQQLHRFGSETLRSDQVSAGQVQVQIPSLLFPQVILGLVILLQFQLCKCPTYGRNW